MKKVLERVDAPGSRPEGSDGVAPVVIDATDPRVDDVLALLERHLAFVRGASPPEDVHALDLQGLLDPEVTLFSARCGARLLAIGAVKDLDEAGAELKCMHTAEEARGQGVGRAMLSHLIGVARARGHRRVSLETGSMGAFAPARALYESAGFTPCGPFGDYSPSPNSTHLTLNLE